MLRDQRKKECGFTLRRFFTAFILLTLFFIDVLAGFSPCKFNFGMAWKGKDYAYHSEIDYVTIWAGSDEDFNQYWIGDMLRECKSGKLAGKTPVFYSYIIAFTARRDLGLLDCD